MLDDQVLDDHALVAISDLTVTWPGSPEAHPRTALAGVSLAVGVGELVGVIGSTGSGRSTLARCLNGIVPHLVDAEVTGDVRVAGLDPRVAGVGAMSRLVSLVLDDAEAQLSQYTVAEEVALGLENAGMPTDEMRRSVSAMLARVGLQGFEDRSPMTLSGGEQQRVVLAGALVTAPRVLVLDEPTVNLDPLARREVLALLAALAREGGMAVVLVDHDPGLLAEHADRLVLLEDGRVALDAPTGVFFQHLARREGGADWLPDVSRVVLDLDSDAAPLPFTVDGAVAWIGARR